MLFEMTTAEAEAAEWALVVAEATVENDPSSVSTRDLITRVESLRGRLSATLSSVETANRPPKVSGVAQSQAAATDIGLALNTVEGFPVREIDWKSQPRFFVVNTSLSASSFFGYTVCDRTKPTMIHGVHYKQRYDAVCECIDEEDAILVCLALNGYMPEARQ